MNTRTKLKVQAVVVVASLLASFFVGFAPSAKAATNIFINEIHYDNASTDTGEAIEVAGPAGTDLAGWSIVLYNGNGGAVYDTITLSGTIPDQQDGFGTLSFPQAGIQNGAPDGMALVDSSNAVVQFLSYEGSFTAVGGPADGMTSTDIGVAESSSTTVGDSLQLTGTGSAYEDFTWAAPAPNTFGAVNTDQTFSGGGPDYTPIYDIQYTADPSGDSPLKDQADVTTEGIVTAHFQYGYFIEDPAGGAWNGLWVHDTTNAPALGDRVRLTGTVIEYYNLTELDLLTGYEVLSSGNALPDPVVLPTGDVSQEQWEGVLVRVENVTVTNPDLGYSEWEVDDGSGPLAVDNLGADTYVPALGDELVAIIGPLNYSYGAFKIAPRDDDDIIPPAAIEIVVTEIMQNPAAVNDTYGEWFELYNAGDEAVDLDGWTFRDAGTDGFTVAGPLVMQSGDYLVLGRNGDPAINGGLDVDYVYSGFTLGNSDDEIIVEDTSASEIDRVEYDGGAVWPDPTGASMMLIDLALDNNDGSNWSETPSDLTYGDGDRGTPGCPNTGCVMDYTPIYDIQYTADPSGDSPYAGQTVTTEGIVTAVFYSGYFIEDPAGGAWNGLWVYDSSGPMPGDRVRLTGTVDEYYNLTELKDLTEFVVESSGNSLPEPSVVTTLDLNQEQWESVFIRVENVTVTNPDLGYGEWQVDDGSGLAVVDDMGDYTYVPVLDDELDYVQGPLTYGFGAFKIEPRDDGDIGLPAPPPDLVINEFLADPAGDLTGDANGDGVRDSGQDELVEIVNDSDSDVNISGWTLSDGYGVRHIFPEETVVSANCAIVIFGGGTPTGGFGGAVVQTASTGALGLNNGGDTITLNDGTTDLVVVTYGSDGGDNQSLTRDPDITGELFVKHSVAAGSGGALFSPGTMIDGSLFSGCSQPFGACGDPATFIHAIQGNGASSPEVGNVHVIEGVVVGDFQTSEHLRGFFIQEEDADADTDPLTSEGIFVYDGSYPAVDVNAGDVVRVMGEVSEYYDLTELGNISNIAVCGPSSIAPTEVNLPADLEPYEGMLITFPEELTASQNYFQGRYGQVTMSSEGRLFNPTNTYRPLTPEAITMAAENLLRMFVLDDGTTSQNPAPIPYIGADDTLRAGDTVAGLTGVVDYGPINSSDPPARYYRIQPTSPVEFTRVNERTAAPEDVGGVIKVASFNVLNYFNGDGMGGGFPTSRGANTLEEFERQRTKIINAIVAMDADVIGLMEIENDGYDEYSAIADLVNGLNDVAGAGAYAFIDPGVAQIGTDEIAVGFIYQPGAVTPVGAAAILDSSVDPMFLDTKNRPALAQTFEENGVGGTFTAVVNHLKSKGSPCDDVADPDTGDGQGNCNLTRTNAAIALTNWLAGDPTGSGDPDFFIIGDLNSYAMEDPIIAIEDAGYTNLVKEFGGTWAYSYIFDGQSGYLDHALASPSAFSQVSGATVWHINTDEPSVIDYNTEYKPEDLYTPTPYRSSDHDPVIVGLDALR